MPSTDLVLYELAGADPDLRFSPHCWKTLMALAHKGLEAERIPLRFMEKEKIAFSGQPLVPVLVDAGTSVSDSWRIALHLEARFPDRPSLFGGTGTIPLSAFVNRWADTILLPAIARIILLDIHDLLDEENKPYFRATRENRFEMPLEEVVADRAGNLAAFRKALAPLRQILKESDFIAGDTPAYADYCVFGMFMWARCTSTTELVESDDPVLTWRDRLLDAFHGLARNARTIQC